MYVQATQATKAGNLVNRFVVLNQKVSTCTVLPYQPIRYRRYVFIDDYSAKVLLLYSLLLYKAFIKFKL